MKKLLSICLLATLAGGTALAAAYVAGKGNLIPATGEITLNEYGCVHGCTAEYEIRHAKALVKADPSLDGTPNVRIVAKVARSAFGVTYLQDVNDPEDFTKWSLSKITADIVDDHFMAFDGMENGFKGYRYKIGDVVSVFGTVTFTKLGSRNYTTFTLYQPTIYRVNEKEDLSILPPAQYLQ